MREITSAVEAAKALGEAREAYAASVVAALDAGVSVQALALELGVSRQAVNAMRKRRKPVTAPAVSDADLDKRIDEIETKWASLVEFYAGQWGDAASDRVAQARLNSQSKAKKARRRTKLSVRGQRFAFAEAKLLSLCRDQRDSVEVFGRCLDELAVLDELLEERERRNDVRF